jgi:integrase
MYSRGLTVNYANRIAKAVKQLMKASAGTHHNSIDFLHFTAKAEKVLPVYLTVDELTTWTNADIPAHLEKYRDLFLIGCYTGLAFRELTSITPDCISTERGRKVITIVRQKTGAVVKIPVLKALDAVLQKYGYQSPQATNAGMNIAIKDIARLAGLNRLVTIKDTTGGIVRHEKKPLHEVISTHCGRRTFATMFSLLGIDTDTIRAILGHSTEAMTRKYIGTEFLAMADNLAKEIESKTNFEFA